MSQEVTLNDTPITPGRPRRGWWQRLSVIGAKVPLVEKMAFTRHLALMIRAGFSLPQALLVLLAQVKSLYFKDVIEQLSEALSHGQLFSEALAKFPKVFPEIYINMVRVGEASGNLEEVLNLLAEQLRKEHELKSRVQGAFMYPMVILIAMAGVGIFMLIFIIPKLTSTLKDLGVPLPFMTQVIINTSDWVANNVFLFLGIIVAVTWALVHWVKRPSGHRTLSWLLLHFPIAQKLTKQINAARLSRTLGSLLSSGVPLIEAFEITARTITNPYYQAALRAVAERIPKGEKLEPNLARFPKLFPPLITQMVGVGEEAGVLTDILTHLANFYEEEVDTATKNLGSLLEPILLIMIGTAVGFFVVSMLMPMFAVYQGF